MSSKYTKVNKGVIDTAREKIGELIRINRKDLGWSMAELSDRAGIRQATLVKLELGRETNLSTLIAVVAAMDGHIEIHVK